MSDFRSNYRDKQNSRSNFNANKSDEPPMSRLFIIGNKENTEDDLREAFSRFGEVEDVWVVKDKKSGDNRGIAYVKFSKTSEAAKAQEEMNGKRIGKIERPVKVIVAANKNQGRSDNEPDRYVRLFIVVPKNATEDELRDEFEKYGDVASVSIMQDRNTGTSKGFAYIRYDRFYHAALAFENCPGKYKAVFAEPKLTRNREGGRDGRDGHRDESFNRYNDWRNVNNNTQMSNARSEMASFLKMQNSADQVTTTLDFLCSNSVNKDQLWRLFDIVPGLDYCQITKEDGPRRNQATVAYNTPEAAIYAKEKIHGLEYPVGERMIFAEPKLTRNREGGPDGRDGNRDESFNRYNDWGNGNNNTQMSNASSEMASFLKMQNSVDQGTTTLDVICSNSLNQDQLWRLFDIVPCLDYCQITREDGPRSNEATVAYNTPEAAIYAKEKIHGLEYPVGERMIVKLSVINPRLDNSMMDDRNQNSMCSVNLPPAAPMASPDAQVARRLFIVLSSSIPQAILKNVFSCFGSLIDVYLLPNRNYGYVKYARDESAQNAIDTLNGVEICSSKIKVMDAEEPGENNRKRVRRV